MTRAHVSAVLLAAGVLSGCDVNSALERLSEARRLSADLLVQFTSAADASNEAVMTETDEASVAFAHEADAAKTEAQRTIDALGPILQALRYADEASLLDRFSRNFAAYRELDRRILDLAAENTNVKAQRLSFGPAFHEADEFDDGLKRLSPVRSEGAWHVRALAAAAVAAVREIQALQAPHIAEAADAKMTEIEAHVRSAEATARNALQSLEPLVDRPSRRRVADARTSLDRFMALMREITGLSRRNTDVRALALALTEKKQVTAACEANLRDLRTALAKRGFFGTR